MKPEARDWYIAQTKNARGLSLQLSALNRELQEFATANGLSELITESLTANSDVLLGTTEPLADVLANVQLSQDYTAFMEQPVVSDGVPRFLFIRKV